MNRNTFLKLLYIPIIIASLLSCTQETTEADEDRVTSDIRVIFSVGGSEGYSHTTNMTRGAITTTPDIAAGFGVSASTYPASGTYTSYGCGNYFFKYEATDNTATPYFWPDQNNEISFFAYYPYGSAIFTVVSTAESTGAPVYRYTVPTTIASQLDIMTAEVTDMTCDDPDVVPLSFAHMLADFRFRFKNVSTQDVTLKSISMLDMKYKGTLQAGSWTLDADRTDFTLTVNRTLEPEEVLDVTGTDNHFLMMPQRITAASQLLDVFMEIEGVEKHFYYTLDADFLPAKGNTYAFTLSLTSELIVSDETDIREWRLDTILLEYATNEGLAGWEAAEQKLDQGTTGPIKDWTEQTGS